MHEYEQWTFRDEDGTWEWCAWDSPQDVLKFLECRKHTDAVIVHRKIITTDWTPE